MLSALFAAVVDAAYGAFTTIPYVTPQEYKHLQNVDLSDNVVSDLRALGKLPHLRTLNVANNRLREFLDFDAPLALTQVDYSYNRLSALGSTGAAALSAHKFLTTINASHNAISSLSSLQALPFLASLDVSYNKIFDVSSLGNRSLFFPFAF